VKYRAEFKLIISEDLIPIHLVKVRFSNAHHPKHDTSQSVMMQARLNEFLISLTAIKCVLKLLLMQQF